MQFFIFERKIYNFTKKKAYDFPKRETSITISKEKRKKIIYLHRKLLKKCTRYAYLKSASSFAHIHTHFFFFPFSIINLKSVPHSVNEKLAFNNGTKKKKNIKYNMMSY